MISTNPPPSYESSQTYHYADIAIEILDTEIGGGIHATQQHPTMSENHSIHLAASDSPEADTLSTTKDQLTGF